MSAHTEKVREAFRWTIYLRVLSQVFTWLVSLLVIRFLTPEDYGVVALTEVVFMFVMLLCASGLGDSLIQEKNLDESTIRKILNLTFLFTILICSLLFISAPFIANIYEQPPLTNILRLSALVFLFTPWLVISSSLLAKKMEFKSRGKIDLYAVVLSSIVSLTLAINGFGFWSLILANLLNIFLRVLGYTFLIKRIYLPKFDFSNMYTSFKFGITVASTSLIFGLFMKLDIVVSGNFIDAETLGLYALAMHLALLPLVKIMPLINQVSYPMYANINDNPAECKRIFFYMLRIICFAIFPLFYIFSIVADNIIFLLLGEQWLNAALALQIILLTIPFRIITNLFSPLLKALGYAYVDLQHITFSCLVVATTFYLSSSHGLTAMALSWLIATPILLCFAIILLTRKVEISSLDILKNVCPPVFISALTYFILFILKENYTKDVHHIFSLIILGFSGAVIYLTLSILFNKKQLIEVSKFRI